jgi:hypothetical protein
MKRILVTLAGLFLFALNAVAQTANHPVIEKVQVMYKPDKSVSNTATGVSSPNIQVNGIVHVTLKSGYDADKLYLKIRDKQTQAQVYDIHYTIGSADVTNQGVLLYKKQGNVLSITNPAVLTLKPYVYELYTEDAEGNKSSVYTIIQ